MLTILSSRHCVDRAVSYTPRSATINMRTNACPQPADQDRTTGAAAAGSLRRTAGPGRTARGDPERRVPAGRAAGRGSALRAVRDQSFQRPGRPAGPGRRGPGRGPAQQGCPRPEGLVRRGRRDHRGPDGARGPRRRPRGRRSSPTSRPASSTRSALLMRRAVDRRGVPPLQRPQPAPARADPDHRPAPHRRRHHRDAARPAGAASVHALAAARAARRRRCRSTNASSRRSGDRDPKAAEAAMRDHIGSVIEALRGIDATGLR